MALFRRSPFVVALACATMFVPPARAQAPARTPRFGVCKPVSERTTPVGCWILVDNPIGTPSRRQVYWHLDRYPTRAAADSAKGRFGTVVDALGKSWLFTIEKAGWRPKRAGVHVADIGPLTLHARQRYNALFMEAITEPGMTSAVHTHSGPEAWYTEAGITCLETPKAKYVGTAGHPAVVPEGDKMFLTAIGKEQRRAITLILHPTGQQPTDMVHDWKPKGLCK